MATMGKRNRNAMTSRDFAYWLQGFFEIQEASGEANLSLTPSQVRMIKKHLALVFYHEIDPSYTNDPQKQQEMNQIHSGTDAVNSTCGSGEFTPGSHQTNSFKPNSHLFNRPPSSNPDNILFRC